MDGPQNLAFNSVIKGIGMTYIHISFAATLVGSTLLTACSPDAGTTVGVMARSETAPVASSDDAADDPAIWVHPTNPSQSLILGTDKRAGLNLYRLDGTQHTFIPAGRLNNVDLRQNVVLTDFLGDLAAATNRSDNSITLFSISANESKEIARFPATLPEPYGYCSGLVNNAYIAFITYKTGNVIAQHVQGLTEIADAGYYKFGSQLEGCVYDDEMQVLYVGEENKGIWRMSYDGAAFGEPVLIDSTGSETGLRADVEGLALYIKENGQGYLVASSQGNNRYTVYDRRSDNAFIKRFSVTDNGMSGSMYIDSVQETDGLALTSVALGPNFPNGMLVVQDGINEPTGSNQNFKIIDWRDIDVLLNADK